MTRFGRRIRRNFAWGAFGLAAFVAMADPALLDPASFTAGPFTSGETGEQAFTIPYAGLNKDQARQFAEGHAQFNEAWVLEIGRAHV